MDGPRSPITVLATRSQLCSVRPPHGPESIGSDWTRVGRKASILLCIIVIVIFFPPCLLQGQRDLGIFLPRSLTNVQRGRGKNFRDVCKIVHTHVNPQKKKIPKFNIFLTFQKLIQCDSNVSEGFG